MLSVQVTMMMDEGTSVTAVVAANGPNTVVAKGDSANGVLTSAGVSFWGSTNGAATLDTYRSKN